MIVLFYRHELDVDIVAKDGNGAQDPQPVLEIEP